MLYSWGSHPLARSGRGWSSLPWCPLGHIHPAASAQPHHVLNLGLRVEYLVGDEPGAGNVGELHCVILRGAGGGLGEKAVGEFGHVHKTIVGGSGSLVGPLGAVHGLTDEIACGGTADVLLMRSLFRSPVVRGQQAHLSAEDALRTQLA